MISTIKPITIYSIILINNSDERLHDPILLLKISMGTRTNVSENYRQFGHILSKKFFSLGVMDSDRRFRGAYCLYRQGDKSQSESHIS
jgi:hypothetical protein